MKTWIICGFIMLLLGSAHAQLYKWTDKNGVTHWGDTPPANMEIQKTKGEIKDQIGKAEKPNTSQVPQKNTGKSSISQRSLKNITPLDPKIAARICGLKSGDREEQLIRLFGQPTGRKTTKDNFLLLNWNSAKWGSHALFNNNGSIASAGAMAKNRNSDVHNFKNDPMWKSGITRLPEVESKWGKGILVKASFSKMLGGQCVKDHVFYLENQKELITLKFVNNILQ